MPATIVRCSVAGVDLQLDQLLRLRHRLGLEHLRHPQLDLHEVVDRDAGVVAGDRRRGVRPVRRQSRRRRRAARLVEPECSIRCLSSLAVPRRSSRFVETAVRPRPAGCRVASVPACRPVHGFLLDAEHPANAARRLGHHRIDERRDDAQRVGGVIERRVERLRAGRVSSRASRARARRCTC